MISFGMIVGWKFADSLSQRILTQQDHPFQQASLIVRAPGLRPVHDPVFEIRRIFVVYRSAFKAAVVVQSRTRVGRIPRYNVPIAEMTRAAFKLPATRRSENSSFGSRMYI